MPARCDEIPIEPEPLAPYWQLSPAHCATLVQTSRRLQGKTVVHINATEKGGGVAVLLRRQIAFERGLGLNSHWLVIRPENPAFFDTTKKIHHLLQGQPGQLSSEEIALYQRSSSSLSTPLLSHIQRLRPDLVIVHDYQPLGTALAALDKLPAIARLHIDTCQPNPDALKWLCPNLTPFRRVIVTRTDQTPQCHNLPPVSVIPPAIDPLSEKSRPLNFADARRVLSHHGLDPDRPIISQVSRFDIWKNQTGLIESFHAVQTAVPGTQLLLAGIDYADDDPTAAAYRQQVEQLAGNNPDIHIFYRVEQLHGISNDTFVNAVQTASDVIVQNSLKEGFGLTVTEAMWKSRAVVGGRASGIMLQIEHNQNGLIAGSVPETAQAVITLLQDTKLRDRLGAAAHSTVQQRFLLPRYLLDNVSAYAATL